MTSNEQFHELFTPVAWEIYTSYLSELKALMEKYQINENRYSVVIQALVDHITECMVNQQLEMINEEWIQGLFQDIGQPSELLVNLGFFIKCWKCHEIMDKNVPSCEICGSISIHNIIDSKIIKKAPIKILKNNILSHTLSKFILFLLLAGMFGIAYHEFFLIFFFCAIGFGVSLPFFIGNNLNFSKYDQIILFFKVCFLKGILLFFIALAILVDALVYKHAPSNLWIQEGLIPVVALLAMISFWVLTASRDRLRFFQFIEEKKRLETRLKRLWRIEFGILMLTAPIIFVSLTIKTEIMFQNSGLPDIGRIIAYMITIVLPTIDGLLHMWFLKHYIWT